MAARLHAPALLAALALLAPLAGCVDSLSENNFSLQANGIGFDKGGTASFNLTYDPRALPAETTYTLDNKFAVERVKFDRVGSLFEEYETTNARDLDLRFFVDGREVSNFTFTNDQRAVELRLKVPAELASDRYTLLVKLFNVGDVESNEFRVADP